MDIDPSESGAQVLKEKSQSLRTLSTGSVSSSISKLSGSSRGIPSDKDFHFYYNFNEFKEPVDEIASNSKLMLEKIGASKHLWGGEMVLPADIDDAYEWLVNVNDEVFERFDMSIDEFSTIRKGEEEGAKSTVDENGFQLVCGKKKKGVSGGVMRGIEETVVSSVVKVAERDKKVAGTKPKVPFHIPTIRRPQDEHNILVNNANHPFEHVWLQRSEDGSRFIHPLEKLSVMDFVDQKIENLESVKPPRMENAPFKLIEEVKDLKHLAVKLRSVNEFAVDLEHNQYRSFQGLTCLMQISTRTEDFVIDTLKLRVHVGPYMRELFKDPTKKKVMHGADRDIIWLQRDFGIYVCNLFDTGQASKVLKLERNSLEYLLHHFCGVTANKEYQNADWRLRPLPDEMLRYAREDTHYLLYIYDLMRVRLLSESAVSEESDAPLVEVYKRSYDVCMQLYEKELLTDTSYLYIYGLQGANFNAQQLSIVAGLYEWRDIVARAEDESTGYILPNKTLLEIAKQMPVTAGRLRRLVRSKHSFVERNLGSVIQIIRHSIQNSSAFEAVAKQLKEVQTEMPPKSVADDDRSEALEPSEAYTSVLTTNDDIKIGNASDCGVHGSAPASLHSKEAYKPTSHEFISGRNHLGDTFHDIGKVMDGNKDHIDNIPECSGEELVTGQITEVSRSPLHGEKAAAATVQVVKRPSRAFGALLGSSASNKKVNPNEEDKMKLEQIKSAVNLPFRSYFGAVEQPKQAAENFCRTPSALPFAEHPGLQASTCNKEEIITLDSNSDSEEAQVDSSVAHPEHPSLPPSTGNLEEVIMIESNSDSDDALIDSVAAESAQVEQTDDPPASASDGEGEEISLSDLSSSFEKCLQSIDQKRNERHKKSGQGRFVPFDYEAARKQVKFAVGADNTSGDGDVAGGKKAGATAGRVREDEGKLAPGRRRQAFPASGNRSATFL
ncbi:hypothetical protein Ancab_015138 [Ancistrocladus abbreviatus]